MQRHASPRTIALALSLSLVAASCTKRSSDYHGPPIYDEFEINDFSDQANDFGVLRPGDHFIIRGNISDAPCGPFSFCDPFDGFAFTAGEPIHVDFSLYMFGAGDDFDVCLYDPLLDLTIDCFQSPFNPELGGVDVFFGGLDFHLVVESFQGSGDYELEIEVYPLYESGPDAPDQGSLPPLSGLRARTSDAQPAREDADSSQFEAYGLSPADAARIESPADVLPDPGE